MQTFHCTTAELLTPEFLRVLAKATRKENQRIEKLSAARRALSIANKLKNSAAKKISPGPYFSRTQFTEGGGMSDVTIIRGIKLNNCKKCGEKPTALFGIAVVVGCSKNCGSISFMRNTLPLAGRAWNRVN